MAALLKGQIFGADEAEGREGDETQVREVTQRIDSAHNLGTIFKITF